MGLPQAVKGMQKEKKTTQTKSPMKVTVTVYFKEYPMQKWNYVTIKK